LTDSLLEEEDQVATIFDLSFECWGLSFFEELLVDRVAFRKFSFSSFFSSTFVSLGSISVQLVVCTQKLPVQFKL